MTEPETVDDTADLDEAARQWSRQRTTPGWAYDTIGLGDLDWAHTNAITARAAADSAESVPRPSTAINDRKIISRPAVQLDLNRVAIRWSRAAKMQGGLIHGHSWGRGATTP